jgi:hypothetical protein
MIPTCRTEAPLRTRSNSFTTFFDETKTVSSMCALTFQCARARYLPERPHQGRHIVVLSAVVRSEASITFLVHSNNTLGDR